MAKFTGKNIKFKDYQKAIFGTDDDANLYWDDSRDEMTITTVISGVYPIDPGHLTTKAYVDTNVGGYPRYYVTTMVVGPWEQYVITETGYLEIVDYMELSEGSMLIVERRPSGYIT